MSAVSKSAGKAKATGGNVAGMVIAWLVSLVVAATISALVEHALGVDPYAWCGQVGDRIATVVMSIVRDLTH